MNLESTADAAVTVANKDVMHLSQKRKANNEASKEQLTKKQWKKSRREDVQRRQLLMKWGDIG